MVLSAYVLSSFKALLTSSRVVPLLAVFVRIVVMAFILVSYSLKPVRTGSMVNDFTKFVPAVIAALVIRCRAVTPIIPRVVNLEEMVSIPFSIPATEKFFVAFSIFAKLFVAASKFNPFFNLSREFKLVLMPDSNCLLSNSI